MRKWASLSPAVITRLTAEWQADFDGVYLKARMEEAAECILVLIGATPEGKKELLGFQTGVRESTQSWRELLVDIKQRGLEKCWVGGAFVVAALAIYWHSTACFRNSSGGFIGDRTGGS